MKTNGKVVRLSPDTTERLDREKRGGETTDTAIRRLAGMPYRKPYRGKETERLCPKHP